MIDFILLIASLAQKRSSLVDNQVLMAVFADVVTTVGDDTG